MAVTTLIQIKQDILVTTSLKQLLHLRIHSLKRFASVFDVEVQPRLVSLRSGQQRRYMSLQQLDRFAIIVIEDDEALDIESRHSLRTSTDIERCGGFPKNLDEYNWGAACPAFVTPTAGKSLNNREPEF